MGLFLRRLTTTLGFLVSFSFIGVPGPAALAKTPVKAAAGVELGGNGSMLLTDPTVGAFGLGAGLQGSVFMTLWQDHPVAAKLRIESISLNQEAVQKSDTGYLQPGTSLKSTSQSWNMISAGAEGKFHTEGQSFFWEALLGYAIGGPSNVTLTPAAPDQPLINSTQTTSSGLVISGGVGIKKAFSPMITGLMTVRSMFLLAPTYATGPLNERTYIPVPILFNVGVEMPFNF